MTDYRVVSCAFASTPFIGMMAKLKRSAESSQVLDFVGKEILPPSIGEQSVPGLEENHHKLKVWCGAVDSAKQNIVLMDADTYIRKPIGDVWEQHGGSWDVAITARPGRFSVNGGVVFVRNTKAARDFMHEWLAVDSMIMASPEHQEWAKQRHGGVNQASLITLLGHEHPGNVITLDCSVWNCVDDAWASFNQDKTRIVHIKGALRKLCLQQKVTWQQLKYVAHSVMIHRPDLAIAWGVHDPIHDPNEVTVELMYNLLTVIRPMYHEWKAI